MNNFMDTDDRGFYIFLALVSPIIWGMTRGIKIAAIIIGIYIIIILCIILLVRLATKKFRRLKELYPNAYSAFRKEFKIFEREDEMSGADIKKFLSISEKGWREKEGLELKRIQQEKQEQSEYNIIREKYSNGLACWKKEHPFASRAVVLDNVQEIINFDRRQKEFLGAEEWERSQVCFCKLCRAQKSAIPHAGCYRYSISFRKTNYKEEVINWEYPVWQFFFYSFCWARDLDYTYFHNIQKNTDIVKDDTRANNMSFLFSNSKEISAFIKTLGKPVQIITFGAELNEDISHTIVNLDLKKLCVQVSDFYQIEELSSGNVIIIDRITTQNQFVEKCNAVIKKFGRQKPCIVYISLMKEYSREEMQRRIDEKSAEIQQKEYVKNEVKAISNAVSVADIETAEDIIRKSKTLVQASRVVDKELMTILDKEEEKLKIEYEKGIVDNFGIQYVDYFIPSVANTLDDWKYPAIKYPKKGNEVFPYRRKAIARRGFSEVGFQNYLCDIFAGYDLLILGDCNILPIENNRPFEPDVAVICKKSPSIRIDIEIDEPYAAVTREPIHYVGGGDDFRDAILNNIGWIVVRFTEYQVFFYPKECAAVIAQLLRCIQPAMALPLELLSCSTLEEVCRWTKIEAEVMASECVREKYLNHEFGEVDNEQLEVTDIKQTERERACSQSIKPLVLASCENKDSTFRERDSHIQFYPQEHIYLYDGREQLIPVSSVISCFFKPFDSLYWSERKASQRNVSQGQILEEWDAKGTCSREVGTFMHQQIKNYYNELPYQQEFCFKYNGKYINLEEQISLEHECVQFMDFLEDHRFRPFRTEWTVYDEGLKVAGTIDMIHKNGNTFDIYDWKRSHRIVDSMGNPIIVNDWGNKGAGELNTIEDTPYWHYCLQQNLYRYILERKYDIVVGKMFLVVFCEDTDEYYKLAVPHMDESIASIVKACNKGTIKQQLITSKNLWLVR